MDFSFHLPTRIVFGYGSLGRAEAEAASMKAERALVVTDRVMVKAGVADLVASRLGGVACEVFDGVEPEPRVEVAEEVAQKVRAAQYDLVVGLGGGSSMDIAKLAACFATNEGPARSFVGNNLFARRPLNSIMVPTTAGTGAELTVTSMVTVDGHKQWVNSPMLLPTVAIVDPELTLTMPQSVTAATGMDALCHNTEAYLSTLASPVTDAAALEGVRLVSQNLERAYDSGSDRKAREAMSLGALLGGIALQAKMVYGHSVGYTIATRFKLAHGVSCGLALPYIASNYAVACGPKMGRLAESYGLRGTEGDPAAVGAAVAARIAGIAKHLGIPATLKELGVKEEELPMLAEECLALYRRANSPLVFDLQAMTHFYRRMWSGPP